MSGHRSYGFWPIPVGIGVLAGLLIVALALPRGGERAAVAPQAPAQAAAAPAQALWFEPEAGQGDAAHDGFIARAGRYAARLTPAGAQILLRRAAGPGEAGAPAPARVGLRLVAANPDAAGAGAGPIRGWSHYYLGNDPAAWRTHVPNYARVEYAAVYPGVDVAWHGDPGGLEFDFIVAPGADPGRIRLAFDGVEGMRLTPEGGLRLATAAGDLTLRRPLAYQERAGRRDIVEAAFDPSGADGAVRLRLGAYDPSRRLIVDPVISYADYLGGSDEDAGLAIAVDAGGNRYVAGSTDSDSFAGAAKDNPSTGTDAFVAKLAPDGTRAYVTFIGGFDTEVANVIQVDGSGLAHVAGDTDSAQLPATAGALQTVYAGGQDAFVARLAADGTLNYLTYLGGSGQDSARALALGAFGDMYVGGSTLSSDFPTQGAFQSALAGEGDGFVSRIEASGTLLEYSTYLGGGGGDNVWALALDDVGAIYVGGSTSSEDFPTAGVSGPYQGSYQGGGSDGFVAKLVDDGSGLVYSTYLGGSNLDRVLALAVGSADGSDGYAYVTGITASDFDFPVSDGTPVYGGGPFDAFLTRFALNGSVADYSTFLGGNGDDQGLAIALPGENQAVIAGATQSDNLALTQPFQVQRLGTRDGFVLQVQLGAGVITQIFSTYLGGTGDDRLTGIAVDASSGEFHVAGSGTSGDLPTVRASQGENAGGTDAYVMRIDRDLALFLPDLRVDIDADPTPVPRRNDLSYTVRVDNEGAGDASGVMVQVEGTNLSALGSPDTGCEAMDGITILCEGGDVGAGGSRSFEIRAAPDQIGPATLTATLVRADQSGISQGNNTASLERLVVDDSDQSSSLSWELLVMMGVPYLLRRRARARPAGRGRR